MELKNEKQYSLRFLELLKISIESMPKEKLALAFSGGVDSSLIAKIMKDLRIDFTAYVVGIEESNDLKSARKVAEEIGIELKEIFFNEKDLEEALPLQAEIIKKLNPDPIALAFNLPIFFVCKNAKEKNIIVCQGPDAMLDGYKKYFKLDRENSIKETKKDIDLFFRRDFLQNNATAEHFNKKLIMPYINKEIIEFCKELPYEMKMRGKTNKYLLRKSAIAVGLKEETALREKQACQYGSGIIKTLTRMTKTKGIHIKDYIKDYKCTK